MHAALQGASQAGDVNRLVKWGCAACVPAPPPGWLRPPPSTPVKHPLCGGPCDCCLCSLYPGHHLDRRERSSLTGFAGSGAAGNARPSRQDGVVGRLDKGVCQEQSAVRERSGQTPLPAPARTDGTLIPTPPLPLARRRLVKRCQKPDRVSAGPLIAAPRHHHLGAWRLLLLLLSPAAGVAGEAGTWAAEAAPWMGQQQQQLTAGSGGGQAERLGRSASEPLCPPQQQPAASHRNPMPDPCHWAAGGQAQPASASLSRPPSNPPPTPRHLAPTACLPAPLPLPPAPPAERVPEGVPPDRHRLCGCGPDRLPGQGHFHPHQPGGCWVAGCWGGGACWPVAVGCMPCPGLLLMCCPLRLFSMARLRALGSRVAPRVWMQQRASRGGEQPVTRRSIVLAALPSTSLMPLPIPLPPASRHLPQIIIGTSSS